MKTQGDKSPTLAELSTLRTQMVECFKVYTDAPLGNCCVEHEALRLKRSEYTFMCQQYVESLLDCEHNGCQNAITANELENA